MKDANQLILDREAWLTEAAQFILDDIIYPKMPNDWNPPNPFRVSVGYPPRSTARSKTIAVCIKAEASASGHSEIFVTPAIGDSMLMLGALAHELVHYSDDCQSGHKNHFARLARAIGLEGPLTATVPGADLLDALNDIRVTLGDIPHSAIDLGKAKAKQTTRMLKIACPSEECKFSFRTSQANIDKITEWLCPACNIEDMTAE